MLTDVIVWMFAIVGALLLLSMVMGISIEKFLQMLWGDYSD